MSHQCHHHHHPVPASFHGAFAIGIALNSAFIGAELWAGWWANSLALMADAVHNLGDVLGLVVAWAGYALGHKAPTTRFTAGFGRMSIYTTILNGLLLVASAVWIMVESIERLQSPQPTLAGVVMAVATVGIVINLGTAFVLLRGQHDINIRGAMLHMLGDAAISAAVVLAAALIAWTGVLWIDPAISLVVALVILWTSWPLLREGMRLAMDGVPQVIKHEEIAQMMQNHPGVIAVHDLRIWALSTTKTALSAHLVITPGIVADNVLKELQHELRHHHGLSDVTLQLEQSHDHCRD